MLPELYVHVLQQHHLIWYRFQRPASIAHGKHRARLLKQEQERQKGQKRKEEQEGSEQPQQQGTSQEREEGSLDTHAHESVAEDLHHMHISNP